MPILSDKIIYSLIKKHISMNLFFLLFQIKLPKLFKILLLLLMDKKTRFSEY